MLAAAPAQAEDWQQYRNARFGTAIDYPGRFRPGRPPDNGDGLGFAAADGASFSVWGSHNVLEFDPAGLERFVRDNLAPAADVTYAARGWNWTAISGIEGDSIFYERRLISHGGRIVNGFSIHYPRALMASYDPIVARMSGSLRPGSGRDTEGAP